MANTVKIQTISTPQTPVMEPIIDSMEQVSAPKKK